MKSLKDTHFFNVVTLNTQIYKYIHLNFIKLIYLNLDKKTYLDLKKFIYDIHIDDIYDYYNDLLKLREWYLDLRRKEFLVDLTELLVELTDMYYILFKGKDRDTYVKSSKPPNVQLHIMFKRLEELYNATKDITKEDLIKIKEKIDIYQKHRDSRRIFNIKKSYKNKGKI